MNAGLGAVVGVVLVLAATPPAVGVGLDEALQAVGAACATTRTALIDQGGAVSDATSTVSLTPGAFSVESPGRNRIVVESTGTYGALSDDGLRSADRGKALGYLKRRGASWWLNEGRYESGPQGWAATFAQSRDEAVRVGGDCAVTLSDAGPDVRHDGGVWTFAGGSEGPVDVVIDTGGRLVRWGQTSYTYTAQSVAEPTEPVAHRAWLKASQAASLNVTMRELARRVAREVNAAGSGVAAIDAAVRAGVPAGRVVALKVRQLRKGVLVYARNPYSGTYHAWRVYMTSGQARARKVAP